MTSLPAQTITEVADHLFALEHGQGEVGVSNAAFALHGGQVLLIDTTVCSTTAARLEHQIQRHGTLSAVVLTHHHIDHIGGAARFASAGIPILAAPAGLPTIQQMQQRFSVEIARKIMPQFGDEFEHMQFPQLAPLVADLFPRFGGEAHLFFTAHTPVDLAVWFPAIRVLVAGDLAFFGVTPLAAEGLISGWNAALETLIALKPLVVIPGHGRIGALHDLLELQTYFKFLQAQASQVIGFQLSDEEGLAETLRAIHAGPLASWLEPQRHELNFARALQEARGAFGPANGRLPGPGGIRHSGGDSSA